jgi:hypothetical protein
VLRKLTVFVLGYKEQKRLDVSLECISSSHGMATILNMLNANQIYNPVPGLLIECITAYTPYMVLEGLGSGQPYM